MEQLKNKVRQFEEVFAGSDTIDESLAIIVSDINPDVAQIIGTGASLYVQEKSFSQGMMRMVGSVNCEIFYHSIENEEIFIVPASVPFSYSKEMTGASAGDKCMTDLSLLTAEAKMLNPRKLQVRVQLEASAMLYKSKTVELVEGIIAAKEEGVNTHSERVELELLHEVTEKKMVLADEIRLSAGDFEGQSRIYKTEVDWQIEDKKVLANKIMLRGSASLNLFSFGEDGRFAGQKAYNVPFSQIVECDGVEAGDSAEITFFTMYKECEILRKSDGSAFLNVDLAANLECLVKRRQGVTIISDAYSTAYQMTYEHTMVSPHTSGRDELVCHAAEVIQTESPAAKVLNVSVCCGKVLIKPGDTLACGSCYVTVLYEDTSGCPCTIHKRIGTEVMLPAPAAARCCAYIKCEGVGAEVNIDGNIDIEFNAVYRLPCVNAPSYRCMSSCALDPKVPKQRQQRASLILRAAQKNERVWDIAKAYNTTPEEILVANKLTEQGQLTQGKLIIIPFVK